MDYREYEKKAITTKAYNQKVAIPYVVLGLFGELGEAYEKLNQENPQIEEVSKELGDCLWYMASIRIELGLSLEENWNWNEKVEAGSRNVPLELSMEAGKIAEQTKKWLRDDWKQDSDNVFPEKRKSIVLEAWKNIWKLLNGLAEHIGLNIETIAIENNEKLASRKERGVIHGSGDNR